MSDYDHILGYLSTQYEEWNGYDFYNYVFPNNENLGELNKDFSKPNAIYLYYDEEQDKMKRRVMLKNTWEDDYIEYIEGNGMTLCGGLAYRGRANRLENAQQMNALIFDIDGVGDHELKTIFLRMNLPANHIRSIPIPTFLVTSGGGLHLYYVLKEPIALFPNIKLQLKALKYDLTFRFWDYKSTSKEKQIQYQSINQGFRMVGSINNKYNSVVRAFKTGDRVPLDVLNQYAKPEYQVDLTKPFKPSKVTKEEASEKWPEWYERVVTNKNKNKKKWDIKGKVNGDDPYALYHWWRRQIDGIKGGHRYFYMMCLCIYACKCDVPLKKLKEDMAEDFKTLSQIEHGNALTEDDMKSALETFSREYYNYTIDDIEKLTDIRIERNKRNYRKQATHIKYMNNQRAFKVDMGECTNGGRPKGSGTAETKVKEWRKAHPEGKKSACHRDTGLDPKTIRKWWD